MENIDVEQLLREYYYNLDKIRFKETNIITLKNTLDKLADNKRAYKSVFIDPTLNMGVSYGEKVQTSKSHTSYAEAAFIRQEEKLEKLIADTATEISDLQAQISITKANLKKMDICLSYLDDTSKKILKHRFGNKYSVDKTAMLVEIPSSTVYSWQKSAMKIIESKLMQM